MTSTEISAIIETCFKCQVARLSYGALTVEFRGIAENQGPGGNLSAGFGSQLSGAETLGSRLGQALKDVVIEEVVDTELNEELRKAQLMTDNPYAYEQEAIDANLSEQESNDSEDAGNL